MRLRPLKQKFVNEKIITSFHSVMKKLGIEMIYIEMNWGYIIPNPRSFKYSIEYLCKSQISTMKTYLRER